MPRPPAAEGDNYYCNEALYGGIHNPDQFAIMPVFSGDDLPGWVVSGAHQSEIGGSEPGGEVIQAHTRHDAGMKQYRGGLGAAVGYAVYQTPHLAFTSSQKESKCPARNGLYGSYSMTVVPGIRVRGSNLLELMAARRGRSAHRRLHAGRRQDRAERRGDRRASDPRHPGGAGG